jgi:3-polyprenyl-4-hydroxybenzoate decarboxylase
MGKYTIVVEDDIDPTNLEQVIWAVVTRSLPDRSIQILNHCRSSNVDTAVPVSEKRSGEKAKPVTSSRVVIDACRDLAWKEDWYPIARVSPELRAQISQKWQSLLSELSK